MLKLVILVVCIGFIAVDAQVTPTPTRTPIPCYYQSGVCGFSNFTMENTEVLFESTKSTSSDYCTPISDCIAFGGCLSFNMLLTIDNELKDVSLFGLGLKGTILTAEFSFLPQKIHPKTIGMWSCI